MYTLLTHRWRHLHSSMIGIHSQIDFNEKKIDNLKCMKFFYFIFSSQTFFFVKLKELIEGCCCCFWSVFLKEDCYFFVVQSV